MPIPVGATLTPLEEDEEEYGHEDEEEYGHYVPGWGPEHYIWRNYADEEEDDDV